MSWDKFDIEDASCKVTVYQVTCIGPDNLTYQADSLSKVITGSDSYCAKMFTQINLDTLPDNRSFTVDATQFSSTHEGTYTFTIAGWMSINVENNVVSQSSSQTFQRKI